MPEITVRLDPSDQHDPSSNDDVILWRSVIRQAMADATDRWVIGCTKRIDSDTIQRQTRAWLTGLSPDFRQVCALADLDPLAIREAAIDYITETDRRRAAGLKHKRMAGRAKRQPPGKHSNKNAAYACS
jgi:hypothetical protein